MIPVRPWARVSWISRAMRWRSSSTPASRAWVSSWACSPSFSAIAASSLWLASASSAIIRLRCWFWSDTVSLRPANTAVVATMTTTRTTKARPPARSDGGRPPKIAVTCRTAAAVTPASRHLPARTSHACRYPVTANSPNHGFLMTRTAIKASRPRK